MVTQTTKKSILQRPDDKEYPVFVGCSIIYLYWSEMTTMQKLLQIEHEREAAQRAAYVAEFNPCGLY